MEILCFLLSIIILILIIFDGKSRKQLIRRPLPIKSNKKAGDKNGKTGQNCQR